MEGLRFPSPSPSPLSALLPSSAFPPSSEGRRRKDQGGQEGEKGNGEGNLAPKLISKSGRL